ncbi:hypothetical protein G6F42_020613 [Rhizopus arrhizus]|nr:hypothetical protein G6F42_020613 [Rhizopus arrhizus]
MKNKRSSTFPAFFSSNLSSSLRTESSPDLSSIMMRHDGRSVSVTDDEDENYEEEEGGYDDEDDDEEDEGLHDTATKLAELVLEPSLTGHQPLHIGTHSSTAAAEADDLPEDLQHHQHQHQHQQPASQSLIQLFSRLAIARRSVKGIDIVLFKESKELYQDEEVMHALARYRNSKQLQH